MRLAMLAAGLFFAAAPAFAAPELSDRLQITEVTGPADVKVTRAAGNRVETAHKGDNLFVGDQVDVAARQLISLASYDGGVWRLAPGTRFRAEARKPDPKNLSYWLFQLTGGAMYGKIPKKNDARTDQEGYRLKVRTKTAALGVRGTEFVLSGDEKAPTVDVLEGTVWWGTDLGFAPGTFKEVAAGHHAEVGADSRVRVADSKGDHAKILRDYGLFAGEATGKTHGTAQQCAAQGLGWRSGDGSNGGECFKGEEGNE